MMLGIRHHVEIPIGHGMWCKVRVAHPALAAIDKFIDWKSYRLGWVWSEMPTADKNSAIQGKG